MDAQWLPFYGEAGLPPEAIKTVATNYYGLAKSDPDVVGLIGYLWPSKLDDENQIGARELPASVINEHIRIGKAITRK